MHHLNYEEYDRWKASQLDSILTAYIDDNDYFNQHKNYFEGYAKKILEILEGFSLLPVYRPEDIKRFEQGGKVYLPMQVKYYLLFISREIICSDVRSNIFPLFEYDKDVRFGSDDRLELHRERLRLIREHEILRSPAIGDVLDIFQSLHKQYNRDQYEEFQTRYCDVCDKIICSGEYYHCHYCAEEFDICADCYADEANKELCNEHQLTKYRRKPPFIVTRDASKTFYCWDCKRSCAPFEPSWPSADKHPRSFNKEQLKVLTCEYCANKHYACQVCGGSVSTIDINADNDCENSDDDNDAFVENGCIFFNSKGCGEGDILILTGPHLGKISCWKYYRPDDKHGNILMHSFFDYLLNKGYEASYL